MGNREDNILEWTMRVVCSYLQNNKATVSEMDILFNKTYRNVKSLSEQHTCMNDAINPAVPIDESVTDDHIVCLECGGRFKMLKRHLMTQHRLSIDNYLARWNLPFGYKIVAPSYRQERQSIAKDKGLGRRVSVAA